MGTITLKNLRTTADVTMNTRLKDGGVFIDWASLTDIKAWLYSDAQKAIAGRCDVSINPADSTKLVCEYAATKPQYLGVNRLIVQAQYMGELKTYDKPAFNFVRWTGDQAGTPVVISDPDVDVDIVVEDVSSSILDAAIAAALQAAADAEHAAHLIPNQVLLDCEAATAAALDAASKAPYIDETTGNWFVWDATAGEYVNSGKPSRGATGNGIASWSVVESEEDGGSNVVTVTFTDGNSETFTYKNGHTGNGIASIVQTVESPDDAGTNVITVTMTNGTVVTFNVKNGSKGQPGAAQAAYKSVDTLPTASAATMDKIYLTPSGTSGVYNMSYTDYDGSAYSWVSLGTTAIQLSDYATKAEVTQLDLEVTDLEQDEKAIVTGGLVWVDGEVWNTTGGKTSLNNWARTEKYPSIFLPLVSNLESDISGNVSNIQINYWNEGIFVGYRLINGYHLPGGASTPSLTYDEFAFSVIKADYPSYETRYIIPSLSDIGKNSYMGIATPSTSAVGANGAYYIAKQEGDYINFGVSLVRGEVAVLVKQNGTWKKQSITGDYTGFLPAVIANGKLPWVVGSYYKYTNCSIVSNSGYARTLFLPAEYYQFISNIENDITGGGSSYYVISYYHKGVYVGYRLVNGYHLPNGTTVTSIDFDSFAISVYKSNITNYETRYVMQKSLSKISESAGVVFNRAFYALGDSTTAGAGSSESPSKSWADRLNGLATFSAYTKKAVSGATCLYHEGSGRLSTQIASLSNIGNAIVTIMIGTNDFYKDSQLGSVADAMSASYSQLNDTTDFARAFRYCVETVRRSFPDCILAVMLPLPSYDAGNAHGHLDETNLVAIRDIERGICNYLGVPVVESQNEFGLSRYTNDWSHFFADFVHPNDTGYMRIAHCMLGKFVELCQ